MTRSGRLVAAALLAAGTAWPTISNATVTVLGWPGGPEETALRATVAAYNASPDVADADKVELIFFNRDGFFDKLQADMAAGSDAFDVNLVATYSLGRYAPFMEPIEAPAPMRPSVFGEKRLDDHAVRRQAVWRADRPVAALHVLPQGPDRPADEGRGWHVRNMPRSPRRSSARICSPRIPTSWTWDDWAATALFFTKQINPDSPVRYGTVLQMKNLLFNMMVFAIDCRAPMAATGWTTRETSPSIQPPTGLRLELYKKLYDAGASPKDSSSYEYAEANAAFGSGQAATMLQWNAAAADLTNPDKSPAVAKVTGIVAPPAGPDGRADHIHGLGLGLNKKAKNKEGAVKFLTWLSSEEAAQLYAKSGGSPALTPDVVAKLAKERPDLVTLGDFASRYGYVMTGATSANALPVYELQAKEFTGYWSGQESLDDALAKTKAGMQDLLKK